MKTLLFVDDDPSVLRGLERQFHAACGDWTVYFADAAPKALQLMETVPVDVVVSDMMMPGMDGAQFLSEVSRRFPNTVRIVLSGHADREAVMRLIGPAHQYLSKPCEPDELRKAVSRAFALQDLLGSDTLKALVGRIRSLPSVPRLYTQLTEELRNEQVSLHRAGEIISRDLAMTAKILQLVNSAFFGLAQPVANPSEALLYLGIPTVRSLVLSMKIFSQYPDRPGAPFSISALAEHSWQTGALSRRLARAENLEEPLVEQCFLAGLLHDVGQLLLASNLPEEYGAVLRVAAQRQTPLWQAEQARWQASHAEAGAYLLGLWGLPNSVVEATAFHHRPAASPSQELSPLALVHAADALARARQGAPPGTAPAGGPQAAWASAGLDMAWLAKAGLAEHLECWAAASDPDL